MTIIVITGLPGSGKTSYAKEFIKEHKESAFLLLDDIVLSFRANPDIFKNPSILFPPKIDNLIITDCLFCIDKEQEKFSKWLTELYPEHKQKWIFFDKDKSQSINNIDKREENKNVLITLSHLDKLYSISTWLEENVEIEYRKTYRDNKFKYN